MAISNATTLAGLTRAELLEMHYKMALMRRFEEKTAVDGTDWINAGIYLLQGSLIEEIPLGRRLSLERDLFPAWANRFRLFGFRCAGRFLDIGTPQAYAEAAQFFPCPEAA